MEFNETSQKARYQCPVPSLCFSGQSENQGLWFAERFFTSPLQPLNRITQKQNFTGSKIWMSPTKFVIFGRIVKPKWPPWPLIGRDIFNFSATAEQNLTKLERKQDFNVLYQVCVFLGQSENQDGRPVWGTQVHNCYPLGILFHIQHREVWLTSSFKHTLYLFGNMMTLSNNRVLNIGKPDTLKP